MALRNCIFYLFVTAFWLSAHVGYGQEWELNTGWKCRKAGAVNGKGEAISQPGFLLTGFLPAVVPGTVLTSLLENKLVPDPYYGMNNERIPDIYTTGRDHYTYWFVNDAAITYPVADERVLLTFRGINYSADIYLNGHKLNDVPDKSMYLRHSYDITPWLAKDGHNRLAVIVFPPDPVGNPNGGQGGDGMIAHSLTNQYVAGWDWIPPVRDRNTGIWDKVLLRRTRYVHVEHTHVITNVPGKRWPEGSQKAASVRVTAEMENTSATDTIEGVAQMEVEGRKQAVKVSLPPMTSEVVEFPLLYMSEPRLWWPNGYGAQALYDLKVRFLTGGKVLSDEEQVTFGIRELKAVWNKKTGSRELHVNGQKIFIKGGNRILSDAMLRFSKERYDAEVRYHRDMNLNLIRVWGGGITERPEFYDACDKYGLMVMQDFWVSGDCNGRWYDALKLEDTNARRNYPDDHALFLESLEDQVTMLRNHPSLVYWCGGNEIRPPADVLVPFRDSILKELDGTRYFFEYSNDDSMSLHSNDGPYTLQPDRFFWEHRSFPFNSEVGSVGLGDYESLERIIPEANLVQPMYDSKEHKWKIDSVWRYHKFCSYDSSVEAYGHPAYTERYAMQAQLVNYNQYRALMEGYSARMWEWYTGVIVWKTQNPWTALVGQMYDVYLDPNACLYGLRTGAAPVHIMYDPVKKNVVMVNNGFKPLPLQAVARLVGADGRTVDSIGVGVKAAQGRTMVADRLPARWDSLRQAGGYFYYLTLADSATGTLTDRNLYWMPDKNDSYTSLTKMPAATVTVEATETVPGRVRVKLSNGAGALAFFMRIAVIDVKTKKTHITRFLQ